MVFLGNIERRVIMTNGPTNPSAPTDSKPKLTKKLPTFRVGFTKQLDALRGYAVLSDGGVKSVHYAKLAEVIKVHEANVSSMNPFFLENGFIEKRDVAYVPTAPVLEYNRQFAWKPETAAQKLAPIINRSWFGRVLTQRLGFRSMSDEDALEVLAAECMAGPEAKPQLRMLLEYCAAAGVLERANGQVSASSAPRDDPEPSPEKPKLRIEPSATPVAPAEPALPQTVTTQPSSDSAINLNIGLQVSLAEMRDWPADRISAFFSGIAQVLAAKNKDG
jgi:hypothetical protein